jgi:hypothetical protein
MSDDDRVPQSPKRAGNGTHANKVAELILGSCRMSDASAHISSVLRDSEGRTIVRVRTDPTNNPLVLLRALQKLWPLAKCSVQENALDGTVEAEIIVPRERDERDRAREQARQSRLSELLSVLTVVLALVALFIYANDCYLSLSSRWANASNATEPGAGAQAVPDQGKSEL